MRLICLVLLLFSSFSISRSSCAAPPNVLLIVVDIIRDGDLKFVRIGPESGLFNARTDPSETTDLGTKRPIVTRQLQTKWRQWDKLSAVKAAKP